MTLTLGSCFSGIGGLELGLEMALGCQTLWQIEIEEYPRQVLAKHWPQADRSVTDIRKAGAHNLKPVDLMVGGFPCQSISTAGKKDGFKEGSKSSLWFEMVRCIGEIRPRYIVLENVPAITSIDKGRVLGRVLGDLARLGYDGEWHRVGASDVGAPHRRWRWFFIGHLSNTHRRNLRQGGQSSPLVTDHGKKKPLANTDSPQQQRTGVTIGVAAQRPNTDHGSTGTKDVANTMCSRQQRQGQLIHTSHQEAQSKRQTDQLEHVRQSHQWAVEPSMGRVANGLPTRLARTHNRNALKALGNAVVPQVSYVEEHGRKK